MLMDRLFSSVRNSSQHQREKREDTIGVEDDGEQHIQEDEKHLDFTIAVSLLQTGGLHFDRESRMRLSFFVVNSILEKTSQYGTHVCKSLATLSNRTGTRCVAT